MVSELAPGATVEYAAGFTVGGRARGTLENFSDVTSDVWTGTSTVQSITAIGQADAPVEVPQSVTITAGDVFDYPITLMNNGESAIENATLRVELPAGLQLNESVSINETEPDTSPFAADGSQLEEVPSDVADARAYEATVQLPVGGRIEYRISGTVDTAEPSGTFSQTAELLSADTQPAEPSNDCSAPSTPGEGRWCDSGEIVLQPGPPDLSVTLTAPSGVTAGEEFTATALIANGGFSTSTGSVAQFTVPNGWSVVSVDNNSACTNNLTRCASEAIEVGGFVELNLDIAVPRTALGTETISVEIVGNEVEAAERRANNVASADINITAIAISSSDPGEWQPLGVDIPTDVFPINPRISFLETASFASGQRLPIDTLFSNSGKTVQPGDYLYLEATGDYCFGSGIEPGEGCRGRLDSLWGVFVSIDAIPAPGNTIPVSGPDKTDIVDGAFWILNEGRSGIPGKRYVRVPAGATHLVVQAADEPTDDNFDENDFGLRVTLIPLSEQIDRINNEAFVDGLDDANWLALGPINRRQESGGTPFFCDPSGRDCAPGTGDAITRANFISTPSSPLTDADEVSGDNFSSAYYRFTFDLPSGFETPDLSEFRVNVDDAAVAYLNGQRITNPIPEICKTASALECIDETFLGWPDLNEFSSEMPTPLTKLVEPEFFEEGTNELVFAVLGDLGTEPTGLEFEARISFTPAASFQAQQLTSVPASVETSQPYLSTNSANPLDVNNDSFISPIDALLVINQLNAMARGDGSALRGAATDDEVFLDTSGDGFLSPLDALLVANHLNGLSRERSSISAASHDPVVERAQDTNRELAGSQSLPIDFSRFRRSFGKAHDAVFAEGDLDGDGDVDVDFSDFLIFSSTESK